MPPSCFTTDTVNSVPIAQVRKKVSGRVALRSIKLADVGEMFVGLLPHVFANLSNITGIQS